MARLTTVLRPVAKWIAENVGRFVYWVLAVAVLFGGAMAAITYALVRTEGATCQVLAGVVMVAGVAIISVVVGGLLTAVRTLQGWVGATGLGPTVSKTLFAQTLGVSDKRPEGKTELAKSLQGKTVGEVRERLRQAFTDVFARRELDRWLPASGKWLASKVVNGAGRLAATAAIDRLPGEPSDQAPIDLIELRNQMGEQIEQTASGFVTFRARLIAIITLLAGSVLLPLLVLGIRTAVRMAGG